VKKQGKRKMAKSNIIVATSTVADGNMYNRHDPTDMAVIANRKTFLKQHGISLEQTTRLRVGYETDDFCRYRVLSHDDKEAGMLRNDIESLDGIVTREPDHALMLPVADCVGATLYDPAQQVMMLSHLGRHSLEQQGAVRSIEFLVKTFGSRPEEIHVWLTPAPNSTVYPIWALDNKGMKEATLEQLNRAGISSQNITNNTADTATDKHYYSYSEFLKGNRSEDGDHMMIAMMTS